MATPDATDADRAFAAEVLRNLLQEIETENAKGYDYYRVSHAWTQGPVMYLVFSAPPSDMTWGLVRDTRESIIGIGSWQLEYEDPARWYYLCDIQENQPHARSRRPGEPDTIWWFGDRLSRLPQRPSDIPEDYQYVAMVPPPAVRRERALPEGTEPRRYADPL